MFAVFVQGFVLGLSLILPIGAQNAFVLSRGIRRNHHLISATLCAVCDIVLICVGVFGVGMLIVQSTLLLSLFTWGGALFLAWYGSLALRSAMRQQHDVAADDHQQLSRKAVIGATLAVTLLNPHVYLDTVMILGSLGSQFAPELRPLFALGTMLASVLWFFTLALGGARLSPWLGSPRMQRVIDLVVGVIMWTLALKLVMG